MGLSGGKWIETILGNVDGITLGIDFVTEQGSSEEYFDVCNNGNLEGLLIGSSLGSTDGNTLALYLEM